MKKISFSFAALLSAVSLNALAAVPTTALELAQSVDISESTKAALVIIALFVAAGVIIRGAMMIYRFFKP